MMNGKKFIQGQSTVGGLTYEQTVSHIRGKYLTNEEYCMLRLLEVYSDIYNNKEVA